VLTATSDEAIKRGNDALKASLLLLLRSAKRFIAAIFYSALNASPLLLSMESWLLYHYIALSPLLFKVTLPISV
jgi:hypothetical protein